MQKCCSCGEAGEGGREEKNSNPDIQKKKIQDRVRLRLTLGEHNERKAL